VAEKECHLVNTLAGQQRPAGNGVAEAMHRGQRTVRHQDRLTEPVALVQDGERGASVAVDRFLLRLAESASDVALPERPTGACGEHEVLRVAVFRAVLVATQDRRQFSRDRNGSHGAVRLGGPDIAVAIDLACELHLGILQVRDPHVRPSKC
jgi:hypothetical protein